MCRTGVTLVLSATLLTGCATPLLPGQWQTVQIVGQSTYLVEGYDTESAIKGGTEYCNKSGKIFEISNIVPHTRNELATIIFRCL